MKSEAPAPEGTGTQHSRQADTSVADGGLAVPDLDAAADTLTAALAYTDAGWYQVPTDPAKDIKHPGSVVGDAWQHQSSRDPKQIAAWYAGTDYGIALHCGRSGAVVFDVDQPDKLPDVLAQACKAAPFQSTRPDTPGRGHYVFRQPPGRVIGNGRGRLGGAWGEVRGTNGVIIAAPTRHPDASGEYRWERTGAVPVLPTELADLLDDASPGEDAATDAQVAAFLAENTAASRPSLINGWISALRTKFETGSRHNAAVSVTVGALKEAAAGYLNARNVIETLGPMFVTAATRPPTGGEKQRTKRAAVDEYRAIVAWAVGQAKAADLDEVRARTAEKMPDNRARMDPIKVNGQPAPAAATAPAAEPVGSAVASAVDGHSGQVRIAYRLAQHYEDRILHVHGLGWHVWDGSRWAPDDAGHTKRAVLAVLRKALAESLGDKELRRDVRKCESASGVAGVLNLAGALPAFAATVRDLDADPYLLNTANGTLDLRTMVLRGHDPRDRITKVTRGAYDPEAPGTTWARHLTRVLPDTKVRDYLQRLTGVALVGKVLEHVLGILTGKGANGKTVFINALAWSLGDYASTAEPDLFMHREGAHPTGEMDLLGRRLMVVSESERDRRLAEATMKRLTGGDIIRARKMRQDFIEFQPSHTPLLITNHLPKVAGDDPAIWRRLRVIPFPVEIPEAERDPRIDELLQIEADAVLAWAVAGWAAYRQQGGLAEPQAVLVATGDYQKSSDAVGRFVAEQCLTGSPVNKATTGQLFEAWDRWRQVDGADQMSLKALGQAIDRLGYPAEKPVNGKRWRVGITLSAVADDE